MIITLICLGLLVVGIILAIIHDRTYFENSNTENVILGFGIGNIMIGAVATLITTVCILTNVANYDVAYQNALHTKNMLEYRIEHMEENIIGNEMLYNDIVEFNNELRSTKKWANNPWTNWFNNQDIASIDYIDIDGN